MDKPYLYKNRLLDLVVERHEMSVEIITYIFAGNFTSEEIWNLIEDYFLGIIPKVVVDTYNKKRLKEIVKKINQSKYNKLKCIYNIHANFCKVE
ncbi:hypothetical protein [Clostridium neonatale]|uniref:hypothetical protein n=1 Tax=Clostridium neonatale TaxID=137838 RepID=UPI00291B360B|nr:hypothetical protein [Clostridium neonatale]CAI3615383.1 hypothetical protein CNEO4_500005 [Clostridium neonatale]